MVCTKKTTLLKSTVGVQFNATDSRHYNADSITITDKNNSIIYETESTTNANFTIKLLIGSNGNTVADKNERQSVCS